MADFTSVLDTTVDKAERPKTVPFGTYVAMISTMPEQRSFNGKDGRSWLALEFKLKLLQPRKDVDQQALADFGPLSNARTVIQSFLAEDNEEAKKNMVWQLRQFFLNTLKLDPGSPPKAIKQLCAESVGKQLLCTVMWESFIDNSGEQGTQARVARTAAL